MPFLGCCLFNAVSEYLHFQGVIHRDIKPGNLLIGTDDTCKIADFGTAILTHSGTIPAGDVKGTPAFMAPELFGDTTMPYEGFPVDIWALGVTLYILVVGIPPYLADNEIKLVEKITVRAVLCRESASHVLEPPSPSYASSPSSVLHPPRPVAAHSTTTCASRGTSTRTPTCGIC